MSWFQLLYCVSKREDADFFIVCDGHTISAVQKRCFCNIFWAVRMIDNFFPWNYFWMTAASVFSWIYNRLKLQTKLLFSSFFQIPGILHNIKRLVRSKFLMCVWSLVCGWVGSGGAGGGGGMGGMGAKVLGLKTFSATFKILIGKGLFLFPVYSFSCLSYSSFLSSLWKKAQHDCGIVTGL